ncbi:unnamed protein product [Euphydryas editha]|uniref:Uncharacterized protein n=1 Tax=Euphydryas editha TaxID=104508 RepID=A0AAU9TVC5_EUPED|nr:unnamed protein product [Euphydryas editha]
METEKIIETTKDSIKIVRLNNPRKKNAIDYDMYTRITKILNDAAIDEDISIVVLTGTGDFYSSGNDLYAGENIPVATRCEIIVQFVKAFITFPKLLIALVNGPAVGIAVTTLPLCDFVFASENAYFYTPFTKLNLVAEGCSSITFPKLMGERKALDMLIRNHKMPAKEALECGLISYLYKHDELQKKAWNDIGEISNLPMDSVQTTKRLIRRVNMEELIKANVLEMKEIERLSLVHSKI